MKILQLANFYHPRSGGLRTAIDALARGYATEGHDVSLLVPGAGRDLRRIDDRTVVTVRAPRVPRSGGYRTIVGQRSVHEAVRRLAPDVIELSDKTTLARAIAAMPDRPPVVVISHERLDRVVAQHVPVPSAAAGRIASLTDRWTRRALYGADALVCASRFASSEFDRMAAARNARRVPPVRLIPLGVDLQRFTPEARHDRSALAQLPPRLPGVRRFVYVGRLSPEKRPGDAIEAVQRVLETGRAVELVIAGGGPLRSELELMAAPSPVTFLGHIVDRRMIATLIADADVAIAPSPNETFGLAALEAMAAGTPVVAVAGGAVAEIVVPGAGATGSGGGNALAAASVRLLDGDRARQRVVSRARAEDFPWERTVDAMVSLFREVVAARAARWAG
ncbi:MAG: glycosyltransferase [Actinomycetota bacterium]